MAAASASDGRVSSPGHVSPAAAASFLRTPVPPYFTRKPAFLTGQTHFLCPGNRLFASAPVDSRKGQKMETSETPVVLRGEPRGIPLVGCKAAENVAIAVEVFKCAAAFAGDMIVLGTLSCKTPHPAGSAAEDRKTKKEYACFSTELIELDKQLTNGLLHDAVQHDEFEAKLGTHLGVRVPKGDRAAKKLVHAMALGLGGATDLKPAAAAKAGAALAALLQRGGYTRVKELGVVWPRIPAIHSAAGAVDVEGAAAADTPAARATAVALPRRLVQSFLESLLVDLHPDKRFKGDSGDKEKTSQLEKITIFTDGCSEPFLEGIDVARIMSRNVYFAQELVNAPANFCNPVALAHAAVQMAKRVGVTAEVLQQKELEDLGMFSYLSVNKGSMYPPQFIHLKYTPERQAPCGRAGAEGGGKSPAVGGGKDSSLKRLVFVGKGVCFDSGGYNIKSAASMIELMKFDMAGAAAVLAAVLALGELQPPHVEVHAIAAACENMVSDKAYRPGDVITAADGKTIEVENTDAEGRLTLADALVYAEKYVHPHVLIDVATLTGAVVVALGHRYAGLYSTCDTLAQQLLHSAETSGELMWRMPLVKEYAEALESKIADLRNIGGKNKAGSILGAVFLEQFVQNTPWAHLDIAGTAWDMKHSRATGYGVRTLVEYAMEISRQQQAALDK